MPQHRRIFRLLLPLLAIFILSNLGAATVQTPEWFMLTAQLAAPPEINKPASVTVKLQALIGTLPEAKVRLILPEGWKVDRDALTSSAVKEGGSAELAFTVTPATFLAQGSIVVEAVLNVPKDDLIARIKRDYPDTAAEMSAAVAAWPAESKRYADIAFALFADESFYPLSGDMWLSYDDKLAPEEGFRGPVFYEDSLITAHQAQTDVEMFDKLQNYIKTDPQLVAKLAESGIDINSKRNDQLNALYVLAVKAYQDRNFPVASGFIDQFEAQIQQVEAGAFESLRIAAANMKGLIFWAQGQKRLAEDALKKAFYANRKHPLQRYILRNIGLLMLSGGDRDTAAQMLNLALPFKQGYTLLEKEAGMVRKTE